MRTIRLFVLIALLRFLKPVPASAQRSVIWQEKPGTWLLNAGVGTTNYTGDLSEWGSLAHLQLGAALSASVGYRYSPHLTLRAEGQIYYLRGTQQNTHLAYNNLSFRSVNPDIWAGVQWDFWRADNRNHVIIPYALAGIGLTYLTPLATYQGKLHSLAPLRTEGVAYNRLPPIVRYGLGVPIVTTERFRVCAEATYTHVLSDYVDDVSTVYADRSAMNPLVAALADRRPEIGLTPWPAGTQRGNASRNDGYFILSARVVFVLITPAQRQYRRMFGG